MELRHPNIEVTAAAEEIHWWMLKFVMFKFKRNQDIWSLEGSPPKHPVVTRRRQ